MTPIRPWTRAALAVASMLATNGCATSTHDETGDDDGTSAVSQALSANPCTAVTMTAPGKHFFGNVGVPLALSAVATCPAGVTPEYQYWVKPATAANWQILGPFVAGGSTWTPSVSGDWAVTVVARATGAPESYQARATAMVGTVLGTADQPPVAVDDAITTSMNVPAATDVLANDSDPDHDVLSVSAFTQGAHGSVLIAGGSATYTPAPGYSGGDTFTYTLDDAHGQTATGTVTVTVTSGPACTISVAGPATAVFGQNMHFTATASCASGPAEVQWYRKANSTFVVVQPFSSTATLDLTADSVGLDLYNARVRVQGTTLVQGTSSTVSVAVADNTPQCTQVRMTAPTTNQNLSMGALEPLTAVATCPAGSVPEYQFWVKVAGAANWQVLPGYTTGNGGWLPPATGAWAVKAVARTVGSHVNYQVLSPAVSVVVTAPAVCGDGFLASSEECDDGNLADNDGCGHSCMIERCGDGLIQLAAGETCDDGNFVDGDGCDSACHVEPFQTTPPVLVSISGGQSCTTAVANAARKIAIDGSGTIYAVMTCGASADVAVSADRGLSFSGLVSLSDGLVGGSPTVSQVAVATGPSDVAYVAMMLASGEVYLRTTQNAGATWSAAVPLGMAFQTSAGLSLQAFNDDIYVGFMGIGGMSVVRNHARGTGTFDTTTVAMSVTFFDLLYDVALGTLAVCADTPTFHIRASNDAGETFGTEVNPPGSEYYSDWAIGNGKIFAGGTRLSGTNDTRLFIIPTNALSTSTSVAGLPSVSTSQTRSLAADTAGNAFVASQLNTGEIRLDRLANGATSFDAPRTIAAAGRHPVVAALPGNAGAAVVYTVTGVSGTEVWVTIQAY